MTLCVSSILLTAPLLTLCVIKHFADGPRLHFVFEHLGILRSAPPSLCVLSTILLTVCSCLGVFSSVLITPARWRLCFRAFCKQPSLMTLCAFQQLASVLSGILLTAPPLCFRHLRTAPPLTLCAFEHLANGPSPLSATDGKDNLLRYAWGEFNGWQAPARKPG